MNGVRQVLGAQASSEAAEADIEPAQVDDLPSLSVMLKENGLPTLGFEECLPNCLLARRGERAIGAVALELHGETALLRSLVVDARERGQGLGQRLTATIVERARVLQVKRVYLLTETASAFFARFGFREIERDAVAAPVARSVEFTTACPATAAVMALELR
jgi:amino-acid N-acetyltransferase